MIFLSVLAMSLSSCGIGAVNTDGGGSENNSSTEAHVHTFSDEWSHDDTKHWHSATCGHDIKKDEGNHEWKDEITQPTGTSGGYTTHTCSVCGYSYRDSETNPLTYTITWKNWDGTILETDNNVAYGLVPSFDGTAPTRPDDDEFAYAWSGWNPEVVPVTADQTYTATYSPANYVISFDLNGGTSSSDSSDKYVQAFSRDVFFFDCVKEEWNFRGWSLNGVKIFDEKGNQLANPILTKRMTFVAMYSQTAKLVIVSNLDDAGDFTGEGEYSYHTVINISAHAKQGYEFIGWFCQDSLLSSDNEYKYSLENKDVTLEARFKLASFLLSVRSYDKNFGLVMFESSQNNNYLSQYQIYCNYKTPITVIAYSKTDVRFLGWYTVGNQLVETNTEYSFAMPNYDYPLEAKWNYFTIKYDLNGGTNNPNNPKSYTVDSNKITLSDPTRSGYQFTGWTYNGNKITEIDPALLDNITLVANWKAKTYSITYELDGGTNDPDNPTSYTIESDKITLKGATRKGYDFAGWYNDSSFSTIVTTINRGSHGDLVLYAKWTPVVYSITYNLDGGTNSSNNPETYTIESAFCFANATKQGYDFAGWFDENGNNVTSISVGTTGALVLTAHWTAIKNNLSVTSEDVLKGTVAIISGSGYSGESITVAATPVDDCVFKGWYHDDSKVSDEATYTFIMPITDYSLVAHFVTRTEELIRLGAIPTLTSDGKKITYGLYPQTNVNDDSLISALNNLAEPESNGWYLFDGDYYAKTSASPYETSYIFNNGTTISSGTTYWFKCEPIIWNVLNNDNGDYLVVSSIILDASCYYHSSQNRYIDDEQILSNNYKYSDIRAWLNASFYNSAFALGNEHIQVTTIDNSASTTFASDNRFVCEDTEDKVFSLSFRDCNNTNYGRDWRRCKATDWARAKGIYLYTQTGYGANEAYFWTRSPTPSSQFDADTYNNGANAAKKVYDKDIGVRPAITIQIS